MDLGFPLWSMTLPYRANGHKVTWLALSVQRRSIDSMVEASRIDYKLLFSLNARWGSLLCTSVYLWSMWEEGITRTFQHTAERLLAKKWVRAIETSGPTFSFRVRLVCAPDISQTTNIAEDGKQKVLAWSAVPNVFAWKAADEHSASSQRKKPCDHSLGLLAIIYGWEDKYLMHVASRGVG